MNAVYLQKRMHAKRTILSWAVMEQLQKTKFLKFSFEVYEGQGYWLKKCCGKDMALPLETGTIRVVICLCYSSSNLPNLP